MKYEEKIKELIKSDNAELAIQLMKGTLGYSNEKICDYIIKYMKSELTSVETNILGIKYSKRGSTYCITDQSVSLSAKSIEMGLFMVIPVNVYEIQLNLMSYLNQL